MLPQFNFFPKQPCLLSVRYTAQYIAIATATDEARTSDAETIGSNRSRLCESPMRKRKRIIPNKGLSQSSGACLPSAQCRGRVSPGASAMLTLLPNCLTSRTESHLFITVYLDNEQYRQIEKTTKTQGCECISLFKSHFEPPSFLGGPWSQASIPYPPPVYGWGFYHSLDSVLP